MSKELNKRPEDKADLFYAIVAFIFWPLGLIMLLVWNDEYPKRCNSIAIGLSLSLLLWIITFIKACTIQV